LKRKKLFDAQAASTIQKEGVGAHLPLKAKTDPTAAKDAIFEKEVTVSRKPCESRSSSSETSPAPEEQIFSAETKEIPCTAGSDLPEIAPMLEEKNSSN
jgi:hypothetical protein